MKTREEPKKTMVSSRSAAQRVESTKRAGLAAENHGIAEGLLPALPGVTRSHAEPQMERGSVSKNMKRAGAANHLADHQTVPKQLRSLQKPANASSIVQFGGATSRERNPDSVGALYSGKKVSPDMFNPEGRVARNWAGLDSGEEKRLAKVWEGINNWTGLFHHSFSDFVVSSSDRPIFDKIIDGAAADNKSWIEGLTLSQKLSRRY